MNGASRTEAIARALREEILRGRYRAGDRLPSERELAARFGCNRGAVREALKKLEQLGLADVKPGGARVVPLREASLDVIGHLLDLADPPDPELVDGVLEAAGALLSATVRVAMDHASDDTLAAARAAARALAARGAEAPEQLAALQRMTQILVDASDNLALHLVRRGLRTQFLPRLRGVGLRPAFDPERVAPIAAGLADAFERRDGAAAAEAMHQLWRIHRDAVRELLAAPGAQPGGGPAARAPRAREASG